MDEDAAVLTAYCRERQHDGASAAAGGALIDRYERHAVAASVLLRGIETDGSGTPLTAVAAGAAPDIRAVLDEVAGPAGSPLITMGRARLLSGDIDPLRLGESTTEATRLTVYCGHADRVYQVPAFEAVCELLYRRGVAGATVLAGIDGTVGGRRRGAQFLGRGGDAPLLVTAVGRGERIGMVLPELGGMFRHPLMTVATVLVCKRDGKLVSRPETLPGTDTAPAGLAPLTRLTLYTSEADRHDGQPVHREVVRRLRSAGADDPASCVIGVQRGIWGFHGEHAPHGDHFPRHDRHAPVVTTVTGAPDRIAAAFDIIDALTSGRGLVTAETVLTPQPAGVGREHRS